MVSENNRSLLRPGTVTLFVTTKAPHRSHTMGNHSMTGQMCVCGCGVVSNGHPRQSFLPAWRHAPTDVLGSFDYSFTEFPYKGTDKCWSSLCGHPVCSCCSTTWSWVEIPELEHLRLHKRLLCLGIR